MVTKGQSLIPSKVDRKNEKHSHPTSCSQMVLFRRKMLYATIRKFMAWKIKKTCHVCTEYPGFQNEAKARAMVGKVMINPAEVAIHPKTLTAPHQ